MQIDSTGKAGAITGTSDIGLDAGLHLRTRRRSAWNLPVLEEKHRWCIQDVNNYTLAAPSMLFFQNRQIPR